MTMMGYGGHRVYVGDIGSRCQREDLQREFSEYGQVIDVYMGGKRDPDIPLFAFVVFKYPEDAEEAVKDRHGRKVCGRQVMVEHARTPRDNSGLRGRGRGNWVPRGRGGYNMDRGFNNNHYNDFRGGRGGRGGGMYGRGGGYDNQSYRPHAPWGERDFRDDYMPRRRSPMRHSPMRRSPLRRSPMRRCSPLRRSLSRERYQRSLSPLYQQQPQQQQQQQQPMGRWDSPVRNSPIERVERRRNDSYNNYQDERDRLPVKIVSARRPVSASPEPPRSQPKKKVAKSRRNRSESRSPSPPPKKKSKKKRRKSSSSEESSSSSSEESRSPTPPPKKKKKKKQKQRSPSRSKSRSKSPGFDAKAYSYFSSVVSSTNNVVTRKPAKKEASVERKEKSSKTKTKTKKYSDSDDYSSGH